MTDMTNVPETALTSDDPPAWLMPYLAAEHAGVPLELDLSETEFDYRVEVLPPRDFVARAQLGYVIDDMEQIDTGEVVIVRDVNGGFLANLDGDPGQIHETAVFPFFQSQNAEELHTVARSVQGLHDDVLALTGDQRAAWQSMVSGAHQMGVTSGYVTSGEPLFQGAFGEAALTPDPFDVRPLAELLQEQTREWQTQIVAAQVEPPAIDPNHIEWLTMSDPGMNDIGF
ncbi:MAG: hypothetical protein ACYDBJ_21605 [Aggregatilineales bacterium]